MSHPAQSVSDKYALNVLRLGMVWNFIICNIVIPFDLESISDVVEYGSSYTLDVVAVKCPCLASIQH